MSSGNIQGHTNQGSAEQKPKSETEKVCSNKLFIIKKNILFINLITSPKQIEVVRKETECLFNYPPQRGVGCPGLYKSSTTVQFR